VTPRLLERRELDAAARMLAAAFDEDPLFAWLLPDAELREHWLRWFFATGLGQSLDAGGAWVLEPDVGAIALLPAGAWPISLAKVVASVPTPTRRPTWRLASAGIHLLRRIAALHPTDRHVYVAILGVHPREKGRGRGGALLRHAAALAREAGVPQYLETGNPVNLTLYRRFGFEVVETIESHGGPPAWTMSTAHGGRDET
jgi:GNAT superfamily N-acetyltransferase